MGVLPVQAAVVIIPATGGQNLSEGSGFVNLTNIIIRQSAGGEIGIGNHIFSLPTGWEFDTSNTIFINTTSGEAVVSPISLKPGVSSFSFSLESPIVNAGEELSVLSMRVRPTGTAGGNITHSGAAIAGVTNGVTSFGTLSVAGGSTPTTPSTGGYDSFYSGGALRPTAPSDISIKINSGATSTDKRSVVLNLGASNAGDMIIANDISNFDYYALEPFCETKNWTLSSGNGTKTVYIKFRSATGVYSDTISASINLQETEQVKEEVKTATVSTPAVTYKATDLNKDGVVDQKDLNLLFANWFNANKISDVNGDGKVDISDFNAVLADWTNTSVPAKATETKDAMFSFSPSLVQVKDGERVSVLVKVRPISNAIYTARLVLNYPSDLLNYESTVYSNGWIPLILGEKSSLVDSASGLVVKTAGYPGGVPMEGTDFAIINFVAKKSGSGTISSNSGSVAMDKKGFDKYSGNLSQTNLLVHGNPVSAQVIASTKDVTQTETTQVVENQNNETKKDTRKSLLAGILGFLTSVPGYHLLFFVLILICYFLYKKYFSSLNEEEAESQFAAIIEREREDDK